ncbi:hypothetical protein CYMTET_27690 [Cymbomonas tetramitiformis]|uniref:Uncharacterized protein n=1 Tax=Cymbomonas tetramitiformis TaxID=36881 RepID=A0AAE0FPU7_9CHLO|nr:hypothetical protein CYMTET_27690 [Cymbomonas tetramitiformis]
MGSVWCAGNAYQEARAANAAAFTRSWLPVAECAGGTQHCRTCCICHSNAGKKYGCWQAFAADSRLVGSSAKSFVNKSTSTEERPDGEVVSSELLIASSIAPKA